MNKLTKSLIRLLSVWLLASAAIGVYNWINILMKGTPFWVDAVFGGLLVITAGRFWMKRLSNQFLRHRFLRWAAWLFMIFAILTALLWAVVPTQVQSQRAWLALRQTNGVYKINVDPANLSLPGLIYTLPSLLRITTFLLGSGGFQVGKWLSTGIWLPFVLFCLGWGVVALLASMLTGVGFASLWPKIIFWWGRLQALLLRLPVRVGRWLALWRPLLSGLTLIGLFIAWPVGNGLINARPVTWKNTTRGPDVPYDVYALVVDPSDGTVYVGTSDSGVFRSTDNGVSWQPASGGLTNMLVQTVALGEHEGTLYVGTFGGGVFRSMDHGKSWQATNAGLTDTAVQAFALDKRNKTLYIGTHAGGVFRSFDEGKSWQAASAGLTIANVWALALNEQEGALYAGTNGGGVFRSLDGGKSWQQTSTELLYPDVWSLAVDRRDGILYAATGGGVFRSTNSGASWQSAGAGMTAPNIRALALDERTGVLYAGTFGGGAFRSTDGGTSWQATGAGLTAPNIRALALDERAGVLYAGTFGGGVFHSLDGGASWQPASLGLTNALALALALDEQKGILYAGTYGGGVFRSTDMGKSWQVAGAGLTNTFVRSLALDRRDGTLYTGAYGGRLFRSRDGGTGWQAIGIKRADANVRVLRLDERTGTLYAGTYGNGVFRSTNGGASWQPANVGFTNPYVLTLLLDESKETLYATNGDGIFRSTDGAASWQAASVGLTNKVVPDLELDEQTGTLYAATYGEGVFRSTDGAASWQAANDGLPNEIVRDVELDERAGMLYAAVNENGVFRSADGGKSWQVASAGLTASNVWVLTLDERDGTLYAGTYGSGVFRSTDKGESWQFAGAGLTNTSILALGWDSQAGQLYAGAAEEYNGRGGLFRSTDGGATWQAAGTGLANMEVLTLALDEQNQVIYAGTNIGSSRSLDGGASWPGSQTSLKNFLLDLLYRRSYGYFFYLPNGQLHLAVHQSELLWSDLIPDGSLRFPAAVTYEQPGGRVEILEAWGATLGQAQLSGVPYRVPLLFVVPFLWARMNAYWLVPGLGLVIALALAASYANNARPLGIPLWAFFLDRRRLKTYAHPAALEAAWLDWQKIIRAELFQHGSAISDDLLQVPGLFRRYALKRYFQTHASDQLLEEKAGQVRLLSGNQLRRWRKAWRIVAQGLNKQSGRALPGPRAVESLAVVLAEGLGLTLGFSRNFRSMRVYQAEAPALGLKIPPRFLLIFLADPSPGAHTVPILADAFGMLKKTGSFALIVPLEPSAQILNIPAELRQTINRSAYLQNFIVLSEEDIQEILVARRPAHRFAQVISKQVDL